MRVDSIYLSDLYSLESRFLFDWTFCTFCPNRSSGTSVGALELPASGQWGSPMACASLPLLIPSSLPSLTSCHPMPFSCLPILLFTLPFPSTPPPFPLSLSPLSGNMRRSSWRASRSVPSGGWNLPTRNLVSRTSLLMRDRGTLWVCVATNHCVSCLQLHVIE